MIEIIECCDEAVTPENLCDRLRKERLKRDWSQRTAAIEEMSDLIKRSDAIKAVSKVDDYGDGIGFEVRSHCLVELELVPSADRPQGKWEFSAFQNDADVANGNYAFICSNCEHTDIHALTQTVPYCWWCGAKMKGGDPE